VEVAIDHGTHSLFKLVAERSSAYRGGVAVVLFNDTLIGRIERDECNLLPTFTYLIRSFQSLTSSRITQVFEESDEWNAMVILESHGESGSKSVWIQDIERSIVRSKMLTLNRPKMLYAQDTQYDAGALTLTTLGRAQIYVASGNNEFGPCCKFTNDVQFLQRQQGKEKFIQRRPKYIELRSVAAG
jgi:hypothetical protein